MLPRGQMSAGRATVTKSLKCAFGTIHTAKEKLNYAHGIFRIARINAKISGNCPLRQLRRHSNLRSRFPMGKMVHARRAVLSISANA